jgi:pimeloyl-ACP methyl ester carboxylesterase
MEELAAPDAAGEGPAGTSPAARAWRVAVTVARGARQVAGDPRVVGVLQAGPSVAYFLARTRSRMARASVDDTVVPARPSAGLAFQAYLDALLLAMFRHPGLLPKGDDYADAGARVAAFRELSIRRGWHDTPSAYHRDPPPPDDLAARSVARPGLSYEHLTFTSGWEPDPDETGRDRWLSHTANRTAHAWMARAPGRDSGSWLVCAHGFGMGTNPVVDVRAFRGPHLLHRGINVVVPVLPLHGLRTSGRVRGEDLMTINMVDSVHGMAQAVWDVRRLIRWLRVEHDAHRVGVIGYSLGGLVAALVAALEDDLACVIAGIPVVDLPSLFRRHMPAGVARRAIASGALGSSADDAHRVVSPLAMECRVPLGRRFIFAGLADRMSTFGQARRLWLHWDRPALATYPGGHLGFFWSTEVKRFVDHALAGSYPATAA